MSTPLGHRAGKVLAQLRQGLADGTWPPGSLLPREVDLCDRFAVSRRTVRAALAVLAGEGQVEPRKRLGTVVVERQLRGLVGVQWSTEVRIIRRAEERLLAAGCLPASYSAGPDGWSPTGEAQFLTRLLDERARALLAIATPVDGGNRTLFRQLLRSGCRIIHLEPYSDADPREEFCMPDYAAWGAEACRRLRAAGAAAVIFVTTAPQAPYGLRLQRGMAEAGAMPPLVVDPHKPEATLALLHGKPIDSGLFFVGRSLAERMLPLLRSIGHRGPLLAHSSDGGDDQPPIVELLPAPRMACVDLALDRILTSGSASLRRTIGIAP